MLDERFAAIVESIGAGASQREAARRHGISPRTVSSWVAKGRREPDGPYGAFTQAVDDIRQRRIHPDTDASLVGTVMGIEELQTIVWQAAQAGSVQAMKLYWEILQWAKERAPKPDPFAELFGH